VALPLAPGADHADQGDHDSADDDQDAKPDDGHDRDLGQAGIAAGRLKPGPGAEDAARDEGHGQGCGDRRRGTRRQAELAPRDQAPAAPADRDTPGRPEIFEAGGDDRGHQPTGGEAEEHPEAPGLGQQDGKEAVHPGAHDQDERLAHFWHFDHPA